MPKCKCFVIKGKGRALKGGLWQHQLSPSNPPEPDTQAFLPPLSQPWAALPGLARTVIPGMFGPPVSQASPPIAVLWIVLLCNQSSLWGCLMSEWSLMPKLVAWAHRNDLFTSIGFFSWYFNRSVFDHCWSVPRPSERQLFRQRFRPHWDIAEAKADPKCSKTVFWETCFWFNFICLSLLFIVV